MEDGTITWSELSASSASTPQHVVFRAFAGETILLNVRSGRYHGLDAVGARFFEVLLASDQVALARDSLVAEYEQPVERIQSDLLAFCDTLHRLGLIELSRAGA